jgi:Secretion system C-terminal sorting domain
MKKQLLSLSSLAFFLCFTISVSAQNTPGTLTFTFTEALPTSPAAPEPAVNAAGTVSYGPANIMAVWIENAAGTFIKTKYRYAGIEKDHLPTWLVKSGGTPPVGTAKGNCLQAACNVTDATTGATLHSTTTPTAYGAKTVTWDGKNVAGGVNGTVVPDGSYKVWVESSWIDSGKNNHQTLESFTFTKGTTVFQATPANTTYFSNISLVWTPTVNLAVNEVSANNLDANVYPNPTNGVFNIDFKNEVTNIKVTNVLGQEVSNQNVNFTASSKTSIDLSSNESGIYTVTLSNNKGNESSYKVVLNK